MAGTPILVGTHVRLEPLLQEHAEALARIGTDPDLWRWTVSMVTSRDDMQRYVRTALAERDAGHALPFVIIDAASGTVAGSTRFGAYAFEQARCIRVELKTDALNERFRLAIRRLGATEEGILRSHMITDTGRPRDTVYYSILAAEWPAVRARLEERLAR